jgi:purine-binding chemotaxis protein CheW
MQKSTPVLDGEQAKALAGDAVGNGKYLVFRLGQEEFGIRVLDVREIMGIEDITLLPRLPADVKGVVNSRGELVPVVDLRLRFGLPEESYTQQTCIVVVRMRGPAGLLLAGIIVEGRAEVLDLAAADIVDAPDFGDKVDPGCPLHMARLKSRVEIVPEIDRVTTSRGRTN